MEEAKRAKKELVSMRKGWEEETNKLLNSIKQQCNTAFNRKFEVTSASPNTSPGKSPRSVIDEEVDGKTISSTKKSSLLTSGILKNVDIFKSLDETEAIVRSLINK